MIYNLLETYEPYVPPTWAGGTDEEIVEALEKHYAGEIDLTEYWHVGDEREISLSAMSAEYVDETHSAQNATIVLVNVGGKTLETPINGHTECVFIWQQKNCLLESGKMKTTSGNYGGWTGASRRSWCNDTYYYALPSWLQTVTKSVGNYSMRGGQNKTITTTYDLCALPCCAEVGLKTINDGYKDEGSQWTYYTDNTKRTKYNKDVSGTAVAWWLRSTNPSSTYYWSGVSNSGGDGSGYPTDQRGIAPFGVI